MARTPEDKDVRRELTRILRSAGFRGARVLRQILRYLVEETLRGEEIPDASSIAIAALGKPRTFKSSRDPSVRVAISRLRTALKLYYSEQGATDDVIIALEKGSYQPTFSLRESGTTPELSTDALELADAYQEIMTPASNSLVLRALMAALQLEPENPRLLAAYADICNDAYKFQFLTVERPLDQAIWALEKALSIEPDLPEIMFQQALIAMVHQDLALAKDLGERMIGLYSHDSAVAYRGAFILSHVSPTISSRKELGLAPMNAVGHPGWLNHGPFLDFYYRQEYEAALGAAMNFGMPHFFWGPLERAAALAQLGILDIAQQQLSIAVSLNPDLQKNPRWHLRHHIKHEDTLEHLLEGLCKAGLHV